MIGAQCLKHRVLGIVHLNYLIFKKKATQSITPSNKAVTNALIYGFMDGFRVQN